MAAIDRAFNGVVAEQRGAVQEVNVPVARELALAHFSPLDLAPRVVPFVIHAIMNS